MESLEKWEWPGPGSSQCDQSVGLTAKALLTGQAGQSDLLSPCDVCSPKSPQSVLQVDFPLGCLRKPEKARPDSIQEGLF